MDFKRFTHSDEWQNFAFEYVKESINTALLTEKVVRVVVSGGNTPKVLYSQIAASNLPLNRVEVFQVDERYVARDSTDLNANMLRATLLKNIVNFADVHLFDIELKWQEAAKTYNALLQSLPEPMFHLTILGLGPDGHTASLFPYSAALFSEDFVATSTTETFAGHARLTLTPRALLQSENILILATGKDKKIVVDSFIAGKESVENLPIMCVRNHPKVTLVYGEF